MICGIYLLPHRPEPVKIIFEHYFYIFFFCSYGRKCEISVGRVDIDDIGLKLQKFRIVEHDIFPILIVLALIYLGPDTEVQQKQLDHRSDVMGCRSAQDRDFLVDESCVGGKKLPL